jgi:hypothetical protein
MVPDCSMLHSLSSTGAPSTGTMMQVTPSRTLLAPASRAQYPRQRGRSGIAMLGRALDALHQDVAEHLPEVVTVIAAFGHAALCFDDPVLASRVASMSCPRSWRGCAAIRTDGESARDAHPFHVTRVSLQTRRSHPLKLIVNCVHI